MTIRIPAEWEPHAFCWMAWVVHSEWKGWVPEVKAELQNVITHIAQYEMVRLPPHRPKFKTLKVDFPAKTWR